MSVDLKKGQKFGLRKSDGGALRQLIIGLGWDEIEQKRGFSGRKLQPIDCDASAFLCIEGVLKSSEDVIYYGKLEHKSGAVKHIGDNPTGEGDGDDERIYINLTKLPPEYDKIVVVVNIYDAIKRRQHFGMIANAYARIYDSETNEEICTYDLVDDYQGKTALILGEFVREDGEWSFGVIDSGTNDANLNDIIRKFSE